MTPFATSAMVSLRAAYLDPFTCVRAVPFEHVSPADLLGVRPLSPMTQFARTTLIEGAVAASGPATL